MKQKTKDLLKKLMNKEISGYRFFYELESLLDTEIDETITSIQIEDTKLNFKPFLFGKVIVEFDGVIVETNL